MKAFAVNQDFPLCIFNFNPHFAKTGDGGETICALQEMSDLCCSLCQGAKHNGAVGDGFVTRYCDLAVKIVKFSDVHNNRSYIIILNK